MKDLLHFAQLYREEADLISDMANVKEERTTISSRDTKGHEGYTMGHKSVYPEFR